MPSKYFSTRLRGCQKFVHQLTSGQCCCRALRDRLLRMADRQLAEETAAVDLAGAVVRMLCHRTC